jgi:sulfate transport system ATP-binding protein
MSIILDNVSKSYGSQLIVDNFSLEIETGELFVLLGASGSGKSTLLRLIAGLIPLDKGRILLDGRDVTGLQPQARNTGFVFQNYSLFRHMTAGQNIEFGLDIRRLPRSERQRKVNELLRLIGLEGLGDRRPGQLSGGQQQRVALARALAYEPSVLLLDEPFGALDVKIRSQLRQNLREIQRQLNVTAIMVTHDQEEAFELADRIGIIDNGKLLEVGTPDSLYRRPKTRFAATFLGVANLLQGQRNGTHVYVGDTTLDAPPNTDHLSGQPVELLVRPEEIELASESEALRGQSLGRGVVRRVEFAGPLERVTVQLNGAEDTALQALLTPSESRRLNVQPDHEVWVGLREYHLLPRG